MCCRGEATVKTLPPLCQEFLEENPARNKPQNWTVLELLEVGRENGRVLGCVGLVRLQPDLHGVDRAHAVVEGVPDLFCCVCGRGRVVLDQSVGPEHKLILFRKQHYIHIIGSLE